MSHPVDRGAAIPPRPELSEYVSPSPQRIGAERMIDCRDLRNARLRLAVFPERAVPTQRFGCSPVCIGTAGYHDAGYIN
jgi:hypothetical protein